MRPPVQTRHVLLDLLCCRVCRRHEMEGRLTAVLMRARAGESKVLATERDNYDTMGQIGTTKRPTRTFPPGKDTRTLSECSVALFSQLLYIVLHPSPCHSYSPLASLQVTLLGSEWPSHCNTWPPPTLCLRYFVQHWAKNSSCKPCCIMTCLR
jgi:hypothetical protein